MAQKKLRVHRKNGFVEENEKRMAKKNEKEKKESIEFLSHEKQKWFPRPRDLEYLFASRYLR